jgi:hypothetical protein
MGRRLNKKRIRVSQFGSCIGLVFEKGGSAEMLMAFPEISRLLDVWSDHERQKHTR